MQVLITVILKVVAASIDFILKNAIKVFVNVCVTTNVLSSADLFQPLSTFVFKPSGFLFIIIIF